MMSTQEQVTSYLAETELEAVMQLALNKTIANKDHPDVIKVEGARKWPDDVAAYAEMMELKSDDPVAFTKAGDREAVRFNFFKYVYSFGSSAC